MLRKAILALGLLLIGIAIGVAGMRFWYHLDRGKWLVVGNEGKGFSWMSEALIGVDIARPEVDKPQGKAKFLDRNNIGRGTRLSYLVTTHIAYVNAAKVPARYKAEQKEGDFTLGPITEVVYSAHMQFTLKDADGFVLMTTKSQPLNLWSGQENVFQGGAMDEIPAGIANRTRAIQMVLTADKCLTCG